MGSRSVSPKNGSPPGEHVAGAKELGQLGRVGREVRRHGDILNRQAFGYVQLGVELVQVLSSPPSLLTAMMAPEHLCSGGHVDALSPLWA